jgi:acylphosphatase
MPRELILKGRVQGVACRYYCSEYGRRLGVHGSASNIRDGNVRVLLDTDDEVLVQRYVASLKTNPLAVSFFGRITDIEVNDYSGRIAGDYEF